MAAFNQTRRYTDLLFVTGSQVAAAADQWRCAPFIVRSQAEADKASVYLCQRYTALMSAQENDSTGDTLLGGFAQTLGNKIKAMNSAYAQLTLTEGDVDPGSAAFATEYYDMLIGYDPATGLGHFQSIMHSGNANGLAQVGTNITRASAAPTAGNFTTATTFTRAANTLASFTDVGRLLVPMWVDFERSA
jgi:hypothetical protein